MAQATSSKECIRRHVEYPFDIWEKMDSLQQARMELFAKMVPEGSRVLDIGCNSGYIVYFVPKTCRCYGVDVAENLVAKANKRIRAKVAPAEKLPFDRDYFDISILGDILEHVYSPEAVIDEAIRVTWGKVIGSVPHERGNWGPKGMHPVEGHDFHVRQYTEKTLQDLLSYRGKLEISTLVHKGKPQMYIFSLSTE